MGITTGTLLGFDPTDVSTTAKFTLGQVVTDNNTTWQYVQAATGSPKVVGFVYPIPSTYVSPAGVSTTGQDPVKLGVCQTAIPALSYGWLAIQGTISALQVLANCAASVPLFVTATAGSLDDGGFSAANLVPGLAAATAVGASAGNVAAFAAVELFTNGD